LRTPRVHFSEEWSYAEHAEPLTYPDLAHFNHGLAEVISAIMDADMRLTAIEEHQTSPWNPFGDAAQVDEHGEFQLRSDPAGVPLTYTPSGH
jgi:hypothetical protein